MARDLNSFDQNFEYYLIYQLTKHLACCNLKIYCLVNKFIISKVLILMMYGIKYTDTKKLADLMKDRKVCFRQVILCRIFQVL